MFVVFGFGFCLWFRRVCVFALLVFLSVFVVDCDVFVFCVVCSLFFVV